MDKKAFERSSIELLAFMLTSARNLMDEPALTALSDWLTAYPNSVNFYLIPGMPIRNFFWN